MDYEWLGQKTLLPMINMTAKVVETYSAFFLQEDIKHFNSSVDENVPISSRA